MLQAMEDLECYPKRSGNANTASRLSILKQAATVRDRATFWFWRDPRGIESPGSLVWTCEVLGLNINEIKREAGRRKKKISAMLNGDGLTDNKIEEKAVRRRHYRRLN
jgi:hypothetical protein